MRPLDLLPRLDEVAPKPLTDLPATLVWLAVEEGCTSPGWGDLRDRLADLRGISADEAEDVILSALKAEDVRPHLNRDSLAWEIRITADSARAVLLRYAIHRLDFAGADLDESSLYSEDDRWLVLAMVPELDAIAHGATRRLDPWEYRHLIAHPPITKET